MHPSALAANLATITRQMENLIRLEYCVILEVDKRGDTGVQNHAEPDSHFYNTCSVKARMIRQEGESDAQKYEHLNCLVLQHDVGNRFGKPYTPRVGDLVAVLFLFNNKPIILGPLVTLSQPPVCRGPADPKEDGQYDDVEKWCQWPRPSWDENLDAYDHPEGWMPLCRKVFHGYPKGVRGPGRDWQMVWDCKKGDLDPTCKECINIDSVPRCGEAWDKVYSEDTESCESPAERMERHAKCGSYIRLESETGNSIEYSEGLGHIRIGNATHELGKKGHINFQGTRWDTESAGTIDVHSAHEEVPLPNEVLGARMTVVAPDDHTLSDVVGEISAELIDLPSSSRVRIYKNGIIQIVSCTSGVAKSLLSAHPDGFCEIWNIAANAYVEISTNGDININSPTKIVLNAPIIDMTNATTINMPDGV